MNDLTITNDALVKASDEKKRRADFMLTDAGQIKARSRMTELIEYLNLCGYRLPDGDYTVMAKIWVKQMEDIIIAYGFDVLHQAIENFVKNDHREYRQMPNAGQIIEEAKKIGYNPDAELARREYEAEISRQDQAHSDLVDTLMTDEKRKELMDKYPTLEAIKEIWNE